MCLKIFTVFIALVALSLGGLRFYGQQDPFYRGMIPLTLRSVHFTHNDIPDLSNKVIIVTGANAGLGKSTAKYLALHGADVIMGCRSMDKCDVAKKQIESELKDDGRPMQGKLIAMRMDLSSLYSIKMFAMSFEKRYKRLDSLVLNAGTMHNPFSMTKDGFEMQFGTNHVGHYYLTRLLLPILKRSQPSTVVVVSSNGHFFSYPEGVRLSLEELNDEKTYGPVLAYGQSKLANVLFAQELAARLKESGDKVYVNSLNPGGVDTDLIRHYDENLQKIARSVVGALPNKIMYTPDYGALTQIYCAVSPEIIQKEISGKYFVPIADECDTAPAAKNITLQKRLWELTESWLVDRNYEMSD